VGDAVRLVDGDLRRATALGELVAQAALAGSRVGNDADDLRVRCTNGAAHSSQNFAASRFWWAQEGQRIVYPLTGP
jgi:hypothetical protein